MIYFLTYIIWIIYSSLFGISDAYYWYSANIGKYSVKNFIFKDLHPNFFWTRSLVASVFAILMSNQNYLLWFPLMICLGLTFPFFHNGFYYNTRNQIDPNQYKLGFKDMSSTSIAKVNFTFLWRTIFFLVGLLGVMLIYTI
jgi:hypothetical protein